LLHDDGDVFDVVEVLLHLIHVGVDVDREHLEPCLDLDDNDGGVIVAVGIGFLVSGY
jgi:hypothetical protein